MNTMNLQAVTASDLEQIEGGLVWFAGYAAAESLALGVTLLAAWLFD